MTKTPKNKVLLIGWDAADWKVITPLVDAGKMPNLKKFLEEGVMGNLATLYPVLSPMLWTSIATGKRAYKHGIHGFVEPDPHTGGVRPITNLGRTTKAIWNILNQEGYQSNVVGWWPSYPVEPINGVMVSDHFKDPHGDLGKPWPLRPGDVQPARLREPLADLRIHPQELEGEQLLPFVPKAAEIDQEKDQRLYSVAKILAECSTIHAVATGLMQLEPWDFMAVYFDAIDHFGHGFMKYHPPKSPWISDRDFELYSNVVESGYRFHDMMLGAYMQLADENTTIIICSDHGFHPDRLRPQYIPNEAAGPAEEHRPFGMIAMRGPNIKQNEVIFGATLLDITPTILSLYDLPVGQDMDGKPLVTAWKETPKVKYIESWDKIEGNAGMHPLNMRMDAVDSHEAVQQLVELGYIEELDADKEKQVQNTIKELRYNLARAYLGANRHLEAIPILEELWEGNTDEPRFGVKLFNSFLALDQVEKARKTFEKIVSNKETVMKEAQAELKEILEEYKDKQPEDIPDNIHRQLRKLRGKASINPASMAFLQGRLLKAEKKYDEAINAYLKAKETAQTHNLPDLYQNIAEIYRIQREWMKAEMYYKEVLELDPVDAEAHLGLGQTYLKSQRNEDALSEILASLGLIYHNPTAHYLCGVALYRCGRIGEAITALERAIAQNPVFPVAHRYLATIYAKNYNNPQKSAQHRHLAREAQQRIKDFKAGKIDLNQNAESVSDWVISINTGNKPKLGASIEDTVIIVSGLPRSGTSMMMQMLAAGGIPIMTDNVREADESNPKGYYEYEKAKQVGSDNSWIPDAKGKVVKIVAQLLPKLPLGQPYRIIFMQRPLSEVISSQYKLLERLGKKGSKLTPEKLAETYQKQLKQVEQVLNYYQEIEVLPINYIDAIANPQLIAAQVNEFLGEKWNENAMIKVIDPHLQHYRS